MTKKIPKTELLYHKSKPIDHLNILEGLALMVEEHKNAAKEVEKTLKKIESGIKYIIEHLQAHKRGRLIYVGAGTSGRIGVQDGVELFPTFNWPKDRLDFIIAGGSEAILSSIENAEDNILNAIKSVGNKKINYQDVVIGLAASGNTPFTCKVLEEAMNKNALTIAISNNPDGKLLHYGKVKIVIDTKQEIIAGSTRLKAGTAQKICLNIISSMVMIKMGFVKNGYMSNLVPTNKKLIKRKALISKILKNEF